MRECGECGEMGERELMLPHPPTLPACPMPCLANPQLTKVLYWQGFEESMLQLDNHATTVLGLYEKSRRWSFGWC